MTDQQTDMTAAELDELEKDLRETAQAFNSTAWRRRDGGQEWSIASIKLDNAADALASLRKQLDEAREQANCAMMDGHDMARDTYRDQISTLETTNAQMAAALREYGGHRPACHWHMGKGCNCGWEAALSQEPPASHAPDDDITPEKVRAIQAEADKDLAGQEWEQVSPASPSPVLRDAVIEECANLAEAHSRALGLVKLTDFERGKASSAISIRDAIRALASGDRT